MNKEENFEIIDDLVLKRITVFEGGACVVSYEPVMDKKTFIECFEKWIKQNDN